MPIFTSGAAAPATGLHSLSVLARLLGCPFDTAQYERSARTVDGDNPHILRKLAGRIGLRSTPTAVQSWAEFLRLPMPCLCRIPARGWVVVVKSLGADSVLVHCSRSGRPVQLTDVDLVRAFPFDGLLFKPVDRDASVIAFGLRWFLRSLAPYRRVLIEILVASFVVQLLALAAPVFFQVVIDKVLAHQGHTTLDVLGLGMLLVIVFEAVLGGLRNYLAAHTSSRIDARLGTDVFGHLLSLPAAYFANRRVGETVTRVRELETIRRFMLGPALLSAIDVLFSGLFIMLMLHYSVDLTLAVLSIAGGFGLLAVLMTPIMRQRLEQQFKTGAHNQAQLIECVSEVATIKSLAAEGTLLAEWEARLAGHVRAVFKAANIASIANQAAAMLQRLAMLVTIWLGAGMVMSAELSVGQLVAFSMIVGRFMLPMQRLIQLWQEFQQVRVSVGRLGELMNTPTEPRNAAALPDMETSIGALEFRHVRFRHRPDDAWILDDVSIAIEPGELVGIVGPSGSGKSTVGSLLQGLYIPEHGAVQVDGLNTRHMDLTRLRRRIAVVRQDTRLFNRSVRENIALASPQADEKRLWSTLELVGAAEFVRRLPRGLDTFLGEGGVNLSGGERQRLAIARALIGEPQVLVLDEATSAVDFEAEEILQSNMKRICQGRTVIIIAHRLSALRSVNRVLTIRKGRIEEDGRPRDLIANGGYFANLVHAQAELMGFRLYREAS